MKYLWLLAVLPAVLAALFLVRLVSHTELDDVHPGIQCDSALIERSDVLWVIPLYNNDSIANNSGWCADILKTGKEIEMHGVYHTYNEFNEKRDDNYLKQGVDVFEACFGYKPEMFKAPQLALSDENKKMIEDTGLKVRGKWSQLFHKVYHCSDTGAFPNWLIRIF